MKLSQEKGSSSWLNVIPLKEMDFDLNKREFRDALYLTLCQAGGGFWPPSGFSSATPRVISRGC